jgi:hypothetical protein
MSALDVGELSPPPVSLLWRMAPSTRWIKKGCVGPREENGAVAKSTVPAPAGNRTQFLQRPVSSLVTVLPELFLLIMITSDRSNVISYIKIAIPPLFTGLLQNQTVTQLVNNFLLLTQPKNSFPFQMIPPLDHTLNRIISVPTLTPYFFKVHLIIVLPYTPTLPVTVAKRSKA